MARKELLPLFPLEVVLFPGAPLPLHIFEPRYRLMIGEAIEQQTEFGVILAEEAAISAVGCTAVVEQVTKRHEDGRFDVLTRGRQRFRALELNKEVDYLRATVDFFQDESTEPAASAIATAAEELAGKVAKALNVELPEDLAIDDPQASFSVAAALPLELKFKQRLLEERSEGQRMRALVQYLSQMLERAQTTQRVQNLARTNGHAGRNVED